MFTFILSSLYAAIMESLRSTFHTHLFGSFGGSYVDRMVSLSESSPSGQRIEAESKFDSRGRRLSAVEYENHARRLSAEKAFSEVRRRELEAARQRDCEKGLGMSEREKEQCLPPYGSESDSEGMIDEGMCRD